MSIVIPTLNEGARLTRLLPTLAWADDVIIVDGGSTDDTVAVATAARVRVLQVHGTTVGGQRNAGIDVARHQWILALDADEMVSAALRDELAALARAGDSAITAYQVRSRNWYLGRELRHGPWGSDWKVRVFTNDRRFDANRVHENIVGVERLGKLSGTLLHWPYRDLAHHVSKSLTYTQWAAADLRDRGRVASTSDIAFRPVARFIRDYILLSGWRDGAQGFIASVVSAFYVFMKYAMSYTGGATNKE